jgi:hypothetical protein
MEVLGLVILSLLAVLMAAQFAFFGFTAGWGTPIFAWLGWVILVVFLILVPVSLLAQLGRGQRR